MKEIIKFSQGINKEGRDFCHVDMGNVDFEYKQYLFDREILKRLNCITGRNCTIMNSGSYTVGFGQREKTFTFEGDINLTNIENKEHAQKELQFRIDQIKTWINSLPYKNEWQIEIDI